jgi:flagellar motor switch protein FliM
MDPDSRPVAAQGEDEPAQDAESRERVENSSESPQDVGPRELAQGVESRKPAEDPSGSPHPPAERIRTLDFSQPTKFTTEVRRRLIRTIEQFCQACSGRLTNELKTEVQLTVAEVDQHTWAAAKSRLPADAVAVAVREPAVERQMLLSVEPPLILHALECLLGGEAAQAPVERHLSEVDWTLARGLLDATVAELSVAWCELGATALARAEIDMEGDAGVLTPVGEPTFSVKLASMIDGQSSAMSLLIPWTAIELIAESIGGSSGQPPPAQAHGPEALRRGLCAAQVLLRAEVGSTQMPIERMLELRPGTLVQLQGRSEDGAQVFAENVPLGSGRPGRSGTRRAIKLQSLSASPASAGTYAKLGRAELERARAHVGNTPEGPEGRAILRSIFVRVWAELGRTHISLNDALELAPGAVVELDQGAEEPVELFANGLCFATGSLIVTADGAWGVQVDRLLHFH